MLSTSTKTRAEKFVNVRRQEENRIGTLNFKLKEEFQMKQLASFENKGKEAAKTNYIQKRISDLRESHSQQIEAKREKLRNLLQAENEEYKIAIKNLEETPQQIREKMFKRVTELKETKEIARKQEVGDKLDRRFREGADELRKVEGDINELRNKHLRNIQIMEKQRLMEQKYEGNIISFYSI